MSSEHDKKYCWVQLNDSKHWEVALITGQWVWVAGDPEPYQMSDVRDIAEIKPPE